MTNIEVRGLSDHGSVEDADRMNKAWGDEPVRSDSSPATFHRYLNMVHHQKLKGSVHSIPQGESVTPALVPELFFLPSNVIVP